MYQVGWHFIKVIIEPAHDKTNKMTCSPREDSDQPGHPLSLIRFFAVHSMGSYGPELSPWGQRRLCSAWSESSLDKHSILLVLSCGTSFVKYDHLVHVKPIWYLSAMRAAKVQASLRIRPVAPEPPLLAHTSSESRVTFRQKARSQAPLNGWACAVKICHGGMLEDINSLDGAHLSTWASSVWSMISSVPQKVNINHFFALFFFVHFISLSQRNWWYNNSRHIAWFIITVMILSFRTDRPGQTVETQIRLLVWSGSTLFAIPSSSFGHITQVKPPCSTFRVITANVWVSELFEILHSIIYSLSFVWGTF